MLCDFEALVTWIPNITCTSRMLSCGPIYLLQWDTILWWLVTYCVTYTQTHGGISVVGVCCMPQYIERSKDNCVKSYSMWVPWIELGLLCICDKPWTTEPTCWSLWCCAPPAFPVVWSKLMLANVFFSRTVEQKEVSFFLLDQKSPLFEAHHIDILLCSHHG